jgi:WD40 repeat protein/serine/threonine protein kinase
MSAEASNEDPPIPAPPPVSDHTLLHRIGRGSYGDVWLARNIMGAYRAVKIVYRARFEDPRPFEREFRGIKKFEPISRRDEGLIDILQIGQNEQSGCFYYVMELADDEVNGLDIHPESYTPKTLKSILEESGRISASQALPIALALTHALSFLHQQGLVHRDIKPSNIVFVNGQPKLADIGLVSEAIESGSFVGTTGFMPPEGPGSKQADIYSLGKVLYEITTGKEATRYPEPATIVDSDFPVWFEGELNEIILRACANDPGRRYPSVEKMRDELLLIQSGRSIRRIRKLEKRLAIATRMGLAACGVAIIFVSAFLHQKQRAEQEKLLRLVDAAKREKNVLAQRLTKSQIDNALRLIDRDQLSAALPYLTAALRRDPYERSAATQLIFALSHHRFARLAFPPLHHEDRVTCALYSPAGNTILTTAADGKAYLWDSQTGERLAGPFAHGSEIDSACFNPAGDHFATGGEDGRVVIWGKSPDQKVVLNAHKAAVADVHFNNDGTALVAASGDNTATLWDLRDNPRNTLIFQHDAPLISAMFSRDCKRVITSSYDGTAKVWNLFDTTKNLVLQHRGAVRSACFSPDDRYVLTSSDDLAARVWDVTTGQMVFAPIFHEQPVLSAEFSPDGALIVTASRDGTARLWGAATGLPASRPLRHQDTVRAATFSRGGDFIATACWDKTLRVWDRLGNVCIESFGLQSERYHTAEFHPSSRQLLSASNGKDVLVWNLEHLPFTDLLLQNDDVVADVAMQVEGTLVATALHQMPGSSAAIWDINTGQQIHSICSDFAFSGSVSFSTNHLLVASDKGSASVWDPLKGKMLRKLRHPNEVTYARFSPDETWILTICEDNKARVWEAGSGKEVGRPVEHESQILGAEFSPDGNRFLSVSKNTVIISSTATGVPLFPPLRFDDPILLSHFTPEGRQIAVASGRTLLFFDALTGTKTPKKIVSAQPIRLFEFNPDTHAAAIGFNDTVELYDSKTALPLRDSVHLPEEIRLASFSPSGRFFVTGFDTGVALCDGQTGQQLASRPLHFDFILATHFSPNEHFLLTASRDHTARVLELPRVELPVPEWMLDLAEVLAGDHLLADNSHELVPPEGILTLQNKIVPGAYFEWAKWFFAAPPAKTLSPAIPIIFTNYLAKLLQNPLDWRHRSALRRLVQLAPQDGPALAALAAISITDIGFETNADEIAEAERLAHRALTFAPLSLLANWAHFRVREAQNRLGDLVEELGKIPGSATNNPFFHLARARLAEKEGRLDESLGGYERCQGAFPSIDLQLSEPSAFRPLLTNIHQTMIWLAEAGASRVQQKFSGLTLLHQLFPPRSPTANAKLIDLSAFYNVSLSNSWSIGYPRNTLEELGGGVLNLIDFQFDVRGIIQLDGQCIPGAKRAFPEKVERIQIGRRASRLHFLHGTVWPEAQHKTIANFVIHYKNGAIVERPIKYGEDVLDWWFRPTDPPPEGRPTVAWTGENQETRAQNADLRLFLTSWENPRPTEEINQIDWVSTMTMCAPFLLAITLED